MCFGETVSDTVPVTERTIETNGVQLHTVEAGEPGAPVVVLAHGFPRAGLFVAPPDPGAGRRRIPRSGPRSARLRPLHPAGGHRRLQRRGAVRRPDRTSRRCRRRKGGVHRPRLGRSGGVEFGAIASRPGGGRSGFERSADTARPDSADPGVPRDLRRQLLLHAPFPGARGGRCRTGCRPGQDHKTDDGWPGAVRRPSGRGCA